MINSFSGPHRFLSNFYPSPIIYGSIIYPTVEHAYQAAKSSDMSIRKQISLLNSPGKAKRAGQNVTLRLDWEEVKVEIMEDLIRIKFQNDDLYNKLLATIGEELIEGNNWGDTFWGVCDSVGENNLGKILMKIRDEM
jgi:N-glycosidase YbiA